MTNDSTTGESGIKTMLTWRGVDGDRLEQVRLNISGARVRAYGRIISAATATHEAFSASYELVTNDSGVTRRLSLRLLQASRESQVDISRDMDGLWMVQTPNGTVRSDFNGAETIDVPASPLFKSLPIRRYLLLPDAAPVQIPVVSVELPECGAAAVQLGYALADGAVTVTAPSATSSLSIDENGLVIDFPGVATRI